MRKKGFFYATLLIFILFTVGRVSYIATYIYFY